MTGARPRKICFVSMEVYATLRPGVAPEAGGAGFQLVQLARVLRDRGLPVEFVVGDYGQAPREEIEGFVAHRANRVGYDGSLRRGLANLWRLFRAMRAARADVFVLRSTRFLAFPCWLYARMLGARYVFMAASMPNCRRGGPDAPRFPVEPLYAFTLARADAVTVQTRVQAELMRANFGVEAALVPNGIGAPPPAAAAPDHDVLWVGSLKPVKRPDRLLDLAARLPGLRFLAAGGPGPDPAYHERLASALAAAPNVDFLGFVPPDRVGACYDRARILLNTSDHEGFPNTFLNAWSRGRPCASLGVDPDGIIASAGLGLVDADPASLADRIAALLADDDAYASAAERCRSHVGREHTLDRLADAFTAALPGS